MVKPAARAQAKSAVKLKWDFKGSSKGKLKAKACPICGKPAAESSRPFCSERCRDVDLNRWLSGSYAIPGREDEDDEGD